MRTSDFDYRLPARLIAQHPATDRSAARLLYLDGASGRIEDRAVRDLPAILSPGDLLVFNDTRVIPARLYARKKSGGRVELLIERLRGEKIALAHARNLGSVRKPLSLAVEGGGELRVLGREAELYLVESLRRPLLELLELSGHVPLPPYIRRSDEPADRVRYQSVLARVPGAVAAPTASLHFDDGLLSALSSRGIMITRITLHIGAGTFRPVRVDDPREHRLHREWCEVPESAVAAIAAARARGGRIVAVGTTVVRALEGAACGGTLEAAIGDTGLYILPGFRFRIVDALITNFHLPCSTLLMLVCAAAGTGRVLAAYRHAVEADYRFYSYGDAMFVMLDPGVRGRCTLR